MKRSVTTRRVAYIGGQYFPAGRSKLPSLESRHAVKQYNKEAKTEIAAIKVDAPNIALRVVDRAIQIHGGLGLTEDVPLAAFWAHLRAGYVR